jgi:hypothetical protein
MNWTKFVGAVITSVGAGLLTKKAIDQFKDAKNDTSKDNNLSKTLEETAKKIVDNWK